MGKICAVPGCRSRNTIGPKQRKSLGLRNLSLFSVPKSEERCTQWKNLLNCELDINQFVCEFHFSEDDIKKCERTVLLDGTVYESPLVRWRLERDALPKCDQEQPMSCEINNNGEGGIVFHDDVAAVEYEEERYPIVLDETQQSLPCPPTEPPKEKVPDDVEMITTAFTVDDLKEELGAGLLPQSWAWTLIPSGVAFTLLGRVDFHPQLHLEVAVDLTLQVRTIADTIVRLDDRATSMRDILRHLEILSRALICSGTGMESKSRHPRCTGMSYPDRNDTCLRTWRCETCRRLRQTLQRNNRRRGQFAFRQDQAKKKAKLEQKKFKRLQRKTQKVLADVADLKQTCSRIEKNALEENISSLPAAQQQAARTCFETAKVKNKSGRRYTTDWIYECLLMRIKNSGLYDHIRDHQILPLPCRETLSRYIQKISTSASQRSAHPDNDFRGHEEERFKYGFS